MTEAYKEMSERCEHGFIKGWANCPTCHPKVKSGEPPKIPEVPCKHCGEMTIATSLRECSACWRLRTLIENRPLIAMKMICSLDMSSIARDSIAMAHMRIPADDDEWLRDDKTTPQGEEI